MATIQAFKSFVAADDDPEEYVKPLQEYLASEGDIRNDLSATEDHLKKLKFTYIEMLTKSKFLEKTVAGDIATNVEGNVAIDQKLAKEKRRAKAHVQALGDIQLAMARPARELAQQWEELDRERKSYLDELAWFEQAHARKELGKGVDRAAPTSFVHPKVLSDAQQLVIDQQHEIEQAKARIAKLRLKSTLHGGPGQADKENLVVVNNTLEVRAERLRREVATLKAEVGGDALRNSAAVEEMRDWYSAALDGVGAVVGVTVIETKGEPGSGSVLLQLRTFYGPAREDGSPPSERVAQHAVALQYANARIASVKVTPDDMQSADLVTEVLEREGEVVMEPSSGWSEPSSAALSFLLRELRARVRAKYSADYAR